ncbi:MAG: hypothetical protein ACN6OI_10105 [Flavobacterium sp.]|uniref:hypothetical protein n=1 Tax=Flavobacterium sp. TaxID=239 RepID=UPI003D09B95F
MNYQDYIYQLVGFIGLPALFTLYLTERVKGSVKNTFDAKMEEIKNVNAKEIEDLKKNHSKEIAEFQTELNHLKSKDIFKFNKLHEIRVEILQKAYLFLSDDLMNLKDFVSPREKDESPNDIIENLGQRRDTFVLKNVEFLKFFRENTLYFDSETEILLIEYFRETDKIYKEFRENHLIIEKGETPDVESNLKAMSVYETIPEIIQPIKLKIKKKFRELLGE